MASLKQKRASFERIKFENKSKKAVQQKLLSTYEDLGKKIPTKLLNGTATKSEMNRYRNTIINTFERKITKQNNDSVNNKKGFNFTKISDLQNQRKQLISDMLIAYDKNFVNDTLQGRTIVLGKGITFSFPTTEIPTIQQIDFNRKFTNQSRKSWINSEIKALKKDILNLKSDQNNSAYILDMVKQQCELMGFNLSDKNLKTLELKLRNVDYLGGVKLTKIMEHKMELLYYKLYKDLLEESDNAELMRAIESDIKKASKDKIIQYARTI